MITDRNEAFKHNSCKKVAQLSKVVVAMRNNTLDRIFQLKKFTNEYNEYIDQLFSDHRKQLEHVSRELFRFRKSTIDVACKDYGQFYKEVKIGFNELTSKQIDHINKTSQEAKDLVETVSNIKQETYSNVNKVLESSDMFNKDINKLKKKSNKSYSQSEIKKAVKPVIDKTKQLEQDSNQRIAEMTSFYNNQKNSLNKEIGKLFYSELRNRKDIFQGYSRRVHEMQSFIKNIVTEYTQYEKLQHQFFTKRIEIRANLTQDFKQKMKNLNQQKQQVIDNKESLLVAFKGEFKSEEKIRIQKKTQMQSELQSLLKQIEEYKYRNSHFLESIEKEKEERDNQLKQKQQSFISTLQQEKNKYLEAINESKSQVDYLNNQILVTQDNFTQSLNTFMRDLQTNHTQFTENIKKQEENVEFYLQNLKQLYIDTNEKKAKELDDLIQSGVNIRKQVMQITTNEIESLKKDKEKLNEDNQKEFEKIERETNEKVKDYENSWAARREGRKSELESLRQRKINEMLKKVESVSNSFNNDLNIKKKEVDDKISEEKEKEKVPIEENENQRVQKAEKKHQDDLNVLNAHMKLAEESLAQAKQIAQTRLTDLDNTIQNQEKLNRQFQRSTKTATDEINQENELKIQVEQVELNTKIDELSKLFDKEENNRAFVIIDYIRKVRNVKNRTTEQVIKAERQIEEIKKDFEKKIKETQEEIERIKKGDHQIELENKIKQLEENEQQEIAKVDAKYNEIKQGKEKEIQSLKDSYEKEKNQIKELSQKDKDDYEKGTKDIEKEKEKIKQNIEVEKQKVIEKIEKRKKELQNEHAKSLSGLQSRISSFKQNLEDVRRNYENDIKKKEQIYEEDSKKHDEKDESFLVRMKDSTENDDTSMKEGAKRLESKISDYELGFQNPDMRDQEKQKIKDLDVQCKQSLKMIQSACSSFIDIINGAVMRSVSLNSILTHTKPQSKPSPIKPERKSKLGILTTPK